jgi:hypothetical protein
MGGLVTTPEKWIKFDSLWSECLEAHNVSALHMKHFAHSEGEFKSWKDDEPKRRRFLNGLLWIIETCIDYAAANAVYIPDYENVDRDYQLTESMRPYTITANSCIGQISIWAKSQGIKEADILWVFEKGDTDQEDMRKKWDMEGMEPMFYKKRDRYPDPDNCKPIRPFEAADLIAYENLKVHKELQKFPGGLAFDEIRKPMQRMVSLPGCKEWGFFNERDLRSVCAERKIPNR